MVLHWDFYPPGNLAGVRWCYAVGLFEDLCMQEVSSMRDGDTANTYQGA